MAIPVVPIIVSAVTHSVVAFVALKKGYSIGYRDGIAAGDWLKSTPDEWADAMNAWVDAMDDYFKGKEESEENKE